MTMLQLDRNPPLSGSQAAIWGITTK